MSNLVAMEDWEKVLQELAETNKTSPEEMLRIIEGVSGSSKRALSNKPVTTLDEDEFQSLRRYGYCVIDSNCKHNHLEQYLIQNRAFFAYRKGLKGSFLVKVVAYHHGRDENSMKLFVLKDVSSG